MKRLTAYRKTRRGRRGSALLLALVLTVVLFLMGLAFVSNTQTDKVIVSGTEDRVSLEQGVDAVVERINTLLVNDLFGADNTLLDGNGDSTVALDQWLNNADEYYDYPGKDDPWLASLEPYEYGGPGTGVYLWRHISDIYGQNQISPYNLNDGTFFNTWYDPVDRNDSTQWDGTAPSVPYHMDIGAGITGILARIVGETEGTEIIQQGGSWTNPLNINLWGARADADGDGVADSRWVQIPNITGPRGQNLYTAVRIIDNCGMMNVNTAFRDPTNLTNNTTSPLVANDWDGSRLGHINLENIMRAGEPAGIAGFQMARFGNSEPATVSLFPDSPPNITDTTDYANDLEYDNDVAQRVLNPAILTDTASNPYHYLPFDIMDELEFRNRYFIDNQWLVSRTESTWPVTFMPGGAYGKKVPYVDSAELSNWFQKAYYDPALVPNYYTRRHICTAYSFDRVMVPEVDINALPPELKNNPDGWLGWTHWSGNGVNNRPICVNDYDPGQADYDPCDWPTKPTLEQIAAAIWMGVEGKFLHGFAGKQPSGGGPYSNWEITPVDFACQLAVNLVDYLDNDSLSTSMTIDVGGKTTTYYGFEPKHKVYISEIAAIDVDDGINPPKRYHAIEIYNPDLSDPVSLQGWQIIIDGNPHDMKSFPDVPAAGTLVLADDPGQFVIQGGEQRQFGQAAFTSGQIILLDPSECPVDAIIVDGFTGSSNVVSAKSRGNWIIDEKLPVWDTNAGWGGVAPDLGRFTPDTGLPTDKRAKIQVANRDDKSANAGEIYNLLGIGSRKVDSDYQTLPEWYNAYRDSGDLESITSGKIDAADPCYANLTRYLTVFSPFSDKADSDGNGKWDDPLHDGVDNDGVGGIDDPGEFRLTDYNELAVAGRININTAPWFVIAQLPWVQDPALVGTGDEYKLAQAIVAYRDLAVVPDGTVNYSRQTTNANWNGAAWVGLDPANADKPRKFGMGLLSTDPDVREAAGFANIAELLNVTHNLKSGPGNLPVYDEYYDMRRFGRDNQNNNEAGNHNPDPGPFFTDDDVQDDLMERDIIFRRMSNLVTVRSDVFTAYILVRLGERGPQKRVIAIFDRSNVFNSSDTPRLVALQPVPDPR